jgi:phosphatidylserine/phosphatidylglycerophosphate/cardiolipin synthase-like enzyme
MGTWDAGPFNNDAAMDFIGELLDTLKQPVNDFLESPEIDETFDAAFAAIAMMNEVMTRTSGRPWHDGNVMKSGPIVAAMVQCFDEQIDGMEPDDEFKTQHRAALMAELDRFQSLLA